MSLAVRLPAALLALLCLSRVASADDVACIPSHATFQPTALDPGIRAESIAGIAKVAALPLTGSPPSHALFSMEGAECAEHGCRAILAVREEDGYRALRMLDIGPRIAVIPGQAGAPPIMLTAPKVGAERRLEAYDLGNGGMRTGIDGEDALKLSVGEAAMEAVACLGKTQAPQ